MAAIDLDTLREMVERAENRAAPYLELGATEAAARTRREINVLRYVIAYHSGEVFPGEVAA